MVKKVVVGKVDLDTCGAGLILGIGPVVYVPVEVVRGEASLKDLADPEVVCLEVGWSGQVEASNFDHHGRENLPSASLQAFAVWMAKELAGGKEAWKISLFCETWEDLHRLARYIDVLDRKGPLAMGEKPGFPTLSELFSGMLLVTREPEEQFKKGVDLLARVLYCELDPFGVMPITTKGTLLDPATAREWSSYAEAKAENDRRVAEAVEQAQWGETSSGLKLAWLETDFIGAPGALYAVGAQVVVAYSPHFGPARVPKFTVAGNGVKVNSVLAELNARESGWGGPPTGTIIGSPREGSKLSLEEVVEVVRKGV